MFQGVKSENPCFRGLQSNLQKTHAHPLHPAALASVPSGKVLVRVRVQKTKFKENMDLRYFLTQNLDFSIGLRLFHRGPTEIWPKSRSVGTPLVTSGGLKRYRIIKGPPGFRFWTPTSEIDSAGDLD